ncbi:MAG: TonB-dependent receptor, partial [Vicinamibacterales bacterium]
MVDGKPVDQLHTGLVPWDALPPLSAIEAIEVVRGGTSALYGSTAIGAVINVITRRTANVRWDAGAGSFGTWRLDGSLGGFAAGLDRTDGYRAHSERSAARARANVRLADGITLTGASYWRDYDEPGALLESLLEADRRASDSLFRFDQTRDHAHALTISGQRGALTASLGGELRRTDAVRTIVLAPGFGDTKKRVADNRRMAATLQFEQRNFTAGVDASYGTLDSKYYEVVNGKRGDVDASGDGSRTTGAVFAQYIVQPTEALRFSLGSRLDWLDDTFESHAASHTAFSPKLGANLLISSNTHVYVTVSRSFKAPSLDQLFDQRSIPVPFPPFSITTSNHALDPQYGTNYEIGVY